MVDVKAGVVYELAVAPPISTKEPEALVCHCIVPVLPVRVMDVVPPVQIVEAVAVAVPPTDAGETVTAAVVEFAEAQAPLVTTAL